MLFITGLDFTKRIPLFDHLQNRGEELLVTAGRKIMRSFRSPFVLFVTCDRAEIISLCEFPREILERALSVSSIAAADCRYSLCGDDAMLHVFLLASGVLSPLFGEDTVQGQIADGAESARLIGSSCPEIDKLLNMAVAFSKRMHSDFRMRVFDRTISDEMERRLAGVGRILIVGSGEGARMLAQRLKDGHEVYMTLRDVSKTFLVPPGVKAVDYERRLEFAMISDAVISASSGLYYTFTEEEVELIGHKPVFDLSMPHDLPPLPSVTKLEDMNIPTPERDEVLSRVREEAFSEMGKYRSWLERSHSVSSVETEADSLAFETMRRLSSAVASLGIDPEKERNLRVSILDSVRKAYISEKLGKSGR